MLTQNIHIILTVLFFIAFIGLIIWAFSPSRRKRFEEDGNLPFVDDDKKTDNEKKVDNEKRENHHE